jgi:hypothetical protein
LADPKTTETSSEGSEGQSKADEATTATTPTKPETDPKYKGLQQALDAEKKQRLAAEATVAQLRGDPTAEERLATALEEADRLRSEIAVRDLKSANPELADVIDVAVAEGTKLTPGVIAAMKAMVKAQGTETAPTRPETSGMRNGAATKTSNDDMSKDDVARKDFLSKAPLF